MSARFDSVVMLTWSDWKSEPRSNRYHYAVRFARQAPVLFVQPDAGLGEEATELTGLTVLHVGGGYGAAQLAPVAAWLARRGLERPLVWIYNPHYRDLESVFPSATRVYHATEDYFTAPSYASRVRGAAAYEQRRWRSNLRRRVIQMVNRVDLVVSVTEGVAEGIREHCAYAGPLLVLENGCDFAFWSAPAPARGAGSRIALYQGGINERLDPELIRAVMRALPDWQFQFCGVVSPGFAAAWEALRREPNLRYLGVLTSEALREAVQRADVGLMPYLQDPIITRQSLPLKAFEYAAAGLPVVSVPIRALEGMPEVFRFAASPEEFSRAIVTEATTRDDTARRAARLAAARAHDYELRFAELQEGLRSLPERSRGIRADALLAVTRLACVELWNRVLFKAASMLR